MAKRRPDPRVTRSALPPLATVKGVNANKALALAMAQERCSHTATVDGVTTRCTNLAPVTSFTVPHTGMIKRYCTEHVSALGAARTRRATADELAMVKRWLGLS